MFLKQSTAGQVRTLGPFVDDTDAKTPETGLTIANTDVKLMKNGAASVNKNSGGGTHRINGEYSFTFDATDSNTVGELKVSINVAGALPVFATFFVLEEVVFDALFGASSVGPLTTLGTNAPANWINAAAIAAAALNGKGDWATEGDVYDLVESALSAYGVAAFDTPMTLSATERNTLAGVIDARLLDAGDATDLIASIVARIGNTNVDQAAFVAAVKAALFDAASAANKLSVNASGEVTVSGGSGGLDAAGIRSAVGLSAANLGSRLDAISLAVDGDEIADAVAARIGSIGLSLQAQNGLSDGDTLTVFAGDDYTGDAAQRFDIDSDDDLTGKRLLIAATHQSQNAKFTLAANISGSVGEQFAMFNPPATLTETWLTGTWTLQYKLELDTNKHKTIRSGLLLVRPHDAASPIVQL